MACPTTLANGMEILLSASLDQCGLSERQIKAIAEEGYLTITNFLLNWYSDIDGFAKKLLLPPEKGGMKLGPALEAFSLLVEEPFKMWNQPL